LAAIATAIIVTVTATGIGGSAIELLVVAGPKPSSLIV
jgi:hypothetical protein